MAHQRLLDRYRDIWSRALKEKNFAAIADWFTEYFFVIATVGLVAAGIAAGADTFASALQQTSANFGSALLIGFAAGFRVFVLSLVFAAASTVSGWLLGLLFGIPRSLARPQPVNTGSPGSSSPPKGQSPDGSAPGGSRVNTNLEDISDWLTKMLVGVGLTQLYTVPTFLWKAAQKMNVSGLGWQDHGQFLALALFCYFAPGGFWLGYVGTRTILTKLFDLIEELDLNREQIEMAADPGKLSVSSDAKTFLSAGGDLTDVDKKLLNVSLKDLTSPVEIAAWGAAQARAGNLTAAQVALEDARKNEPNNQSFKEQLAKIYTLQGEWSKAAELFTSVPDSELQVLNALYLPRPDGFQKAIEIGQRLLADERNKASADLHVWMACAYGQQYAYEKDRKAGDDELKEIKTKMLQEIDAAISEDPRTKVTLRSVWKPDPGSEDNDLTVFGPDDPDLKSRLE
jgi:hypothetical protein